MSSLKSLKGIGPASLKNLKEAGIFSPDDLLCYYPRAYDYRDTLNSLAEVYRSTGTGVNLNTICYVTDFSWFGYGPKKTLKVSISDDSAEGALVCFGRNFLRNSFREGEKYFISGTFSLRFGEIQCSNFEFEPYSESPVNFKKIIPVYPLTGELTMGFLKKIIHQAIEVRGKYLENIIPDTLIEKNALLSRPDAIKNIHFPENRETLDEAVKTIKYEEFFLFQKSMLDLKKEKEARSRKERTLRRTLQGEFLKSLPFKLTEDQLKAVEEIYIDGNSTLPMSRILQGDVGCGKTIVGFLSALPYIESGYQTAFMAPTELLAKQHLESASRLFSGADIKIAFISGKLPESKKKLVREALEAGEIDLIIGTHSLLSEPVKFKNLGFAIVDEQHKFGVAQRSALTGKGDETDFLMMTATPIPRTLQMTFFGDISISTIRSMPAGRGLIKTHTVLQENIQKVYDWVRREIENGFQAYFVYPLVEESEHLNLKNAESMYAHLENDIFPEYKCALLHSRVPEEEKEAVMSGFSKGEIKILAATSVVEVGIDVPKATCMVIEHAERFGLTALHQLRGRIGRSSYPSYSFLVFTREMTEDAKARLRIIKDTTDGFKIAEEDLRLRGPGDITGIRQSGFAEFRLADIIEDQEILEKAREDAIEIYS